MFCALRRGFETKTELFSRCSSADVKLECAIVWFILVFGKPEGSAGAVAELKLPVCIDSIAVLCTERDLVCLSAALAEL